MKKNKLFISLMVITSVVALFKFKPSSKNDEMNLDNIENIETIEEDKDNLKPVSYPGGNLGNTLEEYERLLSKQILIYDEYVKGLKNVQSIDDFKLVNVNFQTNMTKLNREIEKINENMGNTEPFQNLPENIISLFKELEKKQKEMEEVMKELQPRLSNMHAQVSSETEHDMVFESSEDDENINYEDDEA